MKKYRIEIEIDGLFSGESVYEIEAGSIEDARMRFLREGKLISKKVTEEEVYDIDPACAYIKLIENKDALKGGLD